MINKYENELHKAVKEKHEVRNILNKISNIGYFFLVKN